MSLVVFTGAVGMWLAPGAEALHPFIQLLVVLCIALGSGAGGMLNMWIDRDIDPLMKRTAQRPIPAGKIAPDDVLAGGLMLSVASVMLLGLATNWLAAFWLGFAIFFYVVIYSMWLKRITVQNIVIGGAAGAFPPVIGWAAVAGNTPVDAWVLFALIFVWTPPHFWALSLCCHEDYAKAGVPMLPVVRGIKATAKHIWWYSLLLVGTSLLPFVTGLAGYYYFIFSVVSGVAFLHMAWNITKNPENKKTAKQLFVYSIFYLFLLFSFLLLPFGHLMAKILGG